MHNVNTLTPSRTVKDEARMTDNQMTHFFQLSEADENLAAILPGKSDTGKARMFGPLEFMLACLLADLVAADFKTPLAARIVRRVKDAHMAEPKVEQWSVVHTANGNVSTLPYGQAELQTGFISGSRLSFALLIDLKTYADRVERAIEADKAVIGAGNAA